MPTATPTAVPRRRRRAGLLGAVLAVVTGLLVTATPASAFPGAPWFQPYFAPGSEGAKYFGAENYYTHNFPDPDILREGDTYYAYGTSTGGSYLPVMASTDLQNWAPRGPYDPGPDLNPARDPWFNDALPQPARWGGDFGGGRMTKQLWAPGVEKFGDTYVAFYAIRMPTSVSPERYCLSFATADAPIGPFLDRSSGPLHCDSDPKGSIDPEPFVDPATGKPYLLWKSEGRINVHGPRVYVRELDPSGTRFADGTSASLLMTQDQSWEGQVVENPSMIRRNGQVYLFYSGNAWNSGGYATGYATCASVLGPCTKPRGTPLMSSTPSQISQGGASAFLDAGGVLRLAYHYWNPGYTDYPTNPNCDGNGYCASQGQRRMALTEVRTEAWGLAIGPSRPSPVVKTTEQACPTGLRLDYFTDVPASSVHGTPINCVAWWGVSKGNGGRYDPLGSVTRAQMASFLAQAIGIDRLPDPPTDMFGDDDGTTHERNINRLAQAGVVSGKAAGRYAPNELVNRAQMATFLVRAVKFRTGQELTSSADFFWDDEQATAHKGNIDAATAAGLASGAGDGRYAPDATVRRDQMASFLGRTLELFVEAGAPLPTIG